MFTYVVYGSEGDQRKFHSTQQHQLGTEMHFDDGRKFRYALVGATAAVAGNLYQSKAPGANFDELVVPAAEAAGQTTVTVTNGATTITLNQFKEGFINVEDDAGEGYAYKIASNAAEAAGSANFDLVIADPNGLKVAWTAATTVGLTESPFDSVIIHPSPPTTTLVGVAAAAITAAYYGWFQFRGICSVLTEGTLVVGDMAMASETTDGAVAPFAETNDTPIIGRVREVAATTEYSLVDLAL